MLALASVTQHRTTVREQQRQQHVLDCRLGGVVTQRFAQCSVMKRCGVVSCLLSSCGSESMTVDRRNGPPRNITQCPRLTLPGRSSNLEVRRFIVPIRPVRNYIVDPPLKSSILSLELFDASHRLANHLRHLPSQQSHRC